MPNNLASTGSGTQRVTQALYTDWDVRSLVANDGDPIGSFPDIFAGRTFTSLTTARPLYKTNIANGQPSLLFDGINDAMVASGLTLAGAQTIIGVFKPGDSVAGGLVAYEQGLNANTTPGTYLVLQNSSGNSAMMVNRGGGSNRSSYTFPTPAANTLVMLTQITDGNHANHRLYKDGALVQLTNGISSNGGSGNTTADLYLASRASTSLFFSGHVLRLIIFNRMLTDRERRQVEAQLAALYGITYTQTCTYLNSDLVDNVYNTVANDYLQSSPLARMAFATEATAVTVEAYTDYYASFPALSSIGVRVNGADSSTQAFSANNSLRYFGLTLAGGAKEVEVISGPQSIPVATKIGNWIRAVHVTGAASGRDTRYPCLKIYGDSITVGGNATSPTLDAWTEKLRQAWQTANGGGETIEAWGARSLYSDANTGGLRAVFVTQLALFGPSIIWLSIGTNDYGLNLWTAANFGTAYAAVLDDLHATLPNATIYCQTPIERTAPAVETANGLGSTLENYRTQISTAVGTRGPWAVLQAGTGILTAVVDYDTDGIHPNTAGHAKLFTAFRAALGI